MASIDRDKRNSSWVARWRDPAGRQRSKSFRRKVDAQRFLSETAARMHRGDYIDPRAGGLPVGEWVTTWVAAQVHLKASTHQRYRGIVRTHIVPEWGRWKLSAVAPSDVREWAASLLDQGQSPSSIRQIVRVLSLAFDAAVMDGRIARNPVKGVRLPRVHAEEPRFLSTLELGRLVEAAGDDGFSMLFLAVTGLRFGELAALRVRRVDLTRCRVTIAESVTEVGGKLVWSSPKTHAVRSVPFPRTLAESVRDLMAGKGPDDPLFCSAEGQPLRLSNWRRRLFLPACAKADLDGLRVHDLRHTAASLAISAGANVKAVQRMLGHQSAAMTLDVYAGLFGDDLDAVAASLDSLVRQVCDGGPESEDRDLGDSDEQASDLHTYVVGPVGLEPTTSGLKVRCSAN